MLPLPQLKHLYKCCAILVAAVIVDIFLGHIMVLKLAPLLTTFGKFGAIFMILVESIGVELCVVSLIIGIVGGKWIGGRSINGFILSGVYYLYWFTIAITEHPPEFDFLTSLMILGFPLVVTVGGLTYTKVSKATVLHNK